MPFALVTFGLIMIVVGAKGTHAQFGAQLKADFTGPGNFTYWLASIGAVGAVGYVNPFREFSHAFMALIIIAMVVHNGGVFDKLSEAIAKGPLAPSQPSYAPSTPIAPAAPMARTIDDMKSHAAEAQSSWSQMFNNPLMFFGSALFK